MCVGGGIFQVIEGEENGRFNGCVMKIKFILLRELSEAFPTGVQLNLFHFIWISLLTPETFTFYSVEGG